MPSYCFICDCGAREALTSTVAEFEELDSRGLRCPSCGSRMEIDWSRAGTPSTFKSFETPHLLGPDNPVRIDSLSELRKIEKRFDVRFPAYSEDRRYVVERDGSKKAAGDSWDNDKGRIYVT